MAPCRQMRELPNFLAYGPNEVGSYSSARDCWKNSATALLRAASPRRMVFAELRQTPQPRDLRVGTCREDDMTNSAPRKGDVYLKFTGADSYVEIASIGDYSLATTGELSVAAWIRPDMLNFPRWEGTRYVHWLGKGEGAGDSGQQEWVFRMYNR